MSIHTVASRDFARDVGHAKRLAADGPVFITDRGKIIPRRISGNCATHQRKVSTAVKRSRMIALMPFAVTGK